MQYTHMNIVALAVAIIITYEFVLFYVCRSATHNVAVFFIQNIVRIDGPRNIQTNRRNRRLRAPEHGPFLMCGGSLRNAHKLPIHFK